MPSGNLNRRRREQLRSATVSAPSRAEPDVEPVPVLEQESVLDLSNGRRGRTATENSTAVVPARTREIRYKSSLDVQDLPLTHRLQ